MAGKEAQGYQNASCRTEALQISRARGAQNMPGLACGARNARLSLNQIEIEIPSQRYSERRRIEIPLRGPLIEIGILSFAVYALGLRWAIGLGSGSKGLN
jgi:hypothetical protein